MVSFNYKNDYLVYLDKDGNIIIEAPFILTLGVVPYPLSLIAIDFSLYDMTNDGIPEIIINYGMPETRLWINIMYEYLNGEYQQIHTFHEVNPTFFKDSSGQTVMLYNDNHSGIYGYYYVSFHSGAMHIESTIIDNTFFNHLTEEQLDWEFWHDFHSAIYISPGIIADNTTIPGMPEEHLARIKPLEDMQEIITSSINQKLGL